MTEGLATEHVLVADLDTDDLVELVELLDGDLHILIVPFGVFASVDTNVGSPLLSLADFDVD